MRFFSFLLISFTFFSCSSNKSLISEWTNKSPKIYLDESGEKISSKAFQERWRNKKNGLVRWDYGTQDSGRVARLQKPLYSRHFVTYPLFADKIEEITGKTFPPNTIFLLEFTFQNDLCSDYSTNEWDNNR